MTRAFSSKIHFVYGRSSFSMVAIVFVCGFSAWLTMFSTGHAMSDSPSFPFSSITTTDKILSNKIGEQNERPELNNTPADGTLPGGTVPGGTVPGGTLPGGTVPGGTVPGGSLPGGTVPGGTVPGGTLPGGTVPGGTMPSEKLPGEDG